MVSEPTSPRPGAAPGTHPTPATTPPRDRPFFGRVESLRGLGALVVAGWHFTGCSLHGVALFPNGSWAGTGTLQNGLRRLGLALLPGPTAVLTFFVISGFVLQLSLQHGPQRTWAATAKFLLARVFRIYPIVLFGTILTAVLLLCYPAALGPTPPLLTASRFFANCFLLDVSLMPELWALQVEMVMAPGLLLLYFLGRSRGPGVLLGIALITTGLTYIPRWAVWPPLSVHLFAFVLGMVVPTIGRRFAMSLSKRAATRWALAAGIALLLSGPCLGLYSRLGTILEGYAAVTLVSLVAYRQDVSAFKCLDVQGLRRLGLCSGSYYVLHMATVATALAMASALLPPSWSASAPALVGFLVVGAWLVAIAPLMVCSAHLVELPSIALGRRIVRACRLDSPSAAVPDKVELARRRAA